MRCSDTRKLISFFINDELEEPRRREVEAHLDRCSSCRKAADEYASLSRLSRAMPSPAEPQEFYDHFYQEVMARARNKGAAADKTFEKKFAWPAFRPRFAFAGIGVAIAVAVIALLSTLKENGARITLESYLRQRDFTALASAMEDPKLRPHLLNDSVSVDVLAASLKSLERMNAQYGHFGRNFDQVMHLMLQEKDHKTPVPMAVRNNRGATRVFEAAMLPDRLDFKTMLRAIRLIQRPGLKVTLQDLLNSRRNLE